MQACYACMFCGYQRQPPVYREAQNQKIQCMIHYCPGVPDAIGKHPPSLAKPSNSSKILGAAGTSRDRSGKILRKRLNPFAT
mmetsp:Transcript_4147/g.4959  ORF Transcript_4147/g.4959 Transcript_4147/m.4959 type:complete len:82 (-) Transcript_4147:780-1025(-)